MPDEVFWQLRFEPAKWTAEKHVIKVYVGIDGVHQDEFLRGDHSGTLFRGSIATFCSVYSISDSLRNVSWSVLNYDTIIVRDGKTLDFWDMSYDLIDTGRKYFFKYPLGIEINLKGIFLLSDIQGRVW